MCVFVSAHAAVADTNPASSDVPPMALSVAASSGLAHAPARSWYARQSVASCSTSAGRLARRRAECRNRSSGDSNSDLRLTTYEGKPAPASAPAAALTSFVLRARTVQVPGASDLALMSAAIQDSSVAQSANRLVLTTWEVAASTAETRGSRSGDRFALCRMRLLARLTTSDGHR